MSMLRSQRRKAQTAARSYDAVVLGPSLTEARIIKQAGIATINREIPRAFEYRARLQAVEPADRMAEMRRVRIADVLSEMREIDVFVDEMQQMPRALPGTKRAERHAGLGLEQMQETRRRQIDRCSAIGRSHFAAGEIIELRGATFDAVINVAIGQTLAKRQLIEFGGGKTAAPLLQAQGFVSGTNS